MFFTDLNRIKFLREHHLLLELVPEIIDQLYTTIGLCEALCTAGRAAPAPSARMLLLMFRNLTFKSAKVRSPHPAFGLGHLHPGLL